MCTDSTCTASIDASAPARKGKAVGLYDTNYAEQDVAVRVVRLEGRLVLAAHVAGEAAPSYFMLLDFVGDELQFIRDFRYVPYIADEAELVLGHGSALPMRDRSAEIERVVDSEREANYFIDNA